MSDEERIWKFLWERIGNDFGVAGLMGNLCAESALISTNLQNTAERASGWTDETYTKAVDDGSYTEDSFVSDGFGYGVCQWTYWTRKRDLYKFAKSTGRSIGDLGMQLEYLWAELGGYSDVISTLISAKSVREASDAVLLKFEKPADQSMQNRETRAKYGQRYYDKYATSSLHRELTIYKRYFYQSDCYNSGTKITPSGVQVHSTGANNPWLKRYVQPDDGRIGVNHYGNSHNKPGGNVCAHCYIGKQSDGTVAVYQALPWDYKCWLSGSGKNGNANNRGYLGFEVCEDCLNDEAYFKDAIMDKAVLLTAYWCQEFGLNPDDIVRDHSELHSLGLASNHGDITLWLRHWNKTMDDFRAAVKKALENGVKVTYINCDEVTVLYKATAINPGSYLNIRNGKGQMYKSIGKVPQGAVVNVIDDSDGTWWYIQYQDIFGYAMSEYLQKIEETPVDPVEPTGDTITIPTETAKRLMELCGEMYTLLQKQIGE